MKILASILILFFGYNLAFAHSCATWARVSDKEHSQKLKEIDAIFFGEIIAINQPNRSSENYSEYMQILQIKVLRVWKGAETSELSVAYSYPYTTYQMDNGSIGIQKLFYAQKSKDNSKLVADSCSFTAFDDERMKREYGEGKIIEHPQTVETIETNDGFWSAIWKKIVSFFS